MVSLIKTTTCRARKKRPKELPSLTPSATKNVTYQEKKRERGKWKGKEYTHEYTHSYPHNHLPSIILSRHAQPVHISRFAPAPGRTDPASPPIPATAPPSSPLSQATLNPLTNFVKPILVCDGAERLELEPASMPTTAAPAACLFRRRRARGEEVHV